MTPTLAVTIWMHGLARTVRFILWRVGHEPAIPAQRLDGMERLQTLAFTPLLLSVLPAN